MPVFLDRPHQIIHRLIVLHLVGVLPERMERMKLRHFSDRRFFPSSTGRGGTSGVGGKLISGGGTAASLTGAALPGFTALADLDAGAPPEPVSLPLSAFLPLDTLSRTAGGASSRAALSTLDGRPVRGSAAFDFFSTVGPACSFGGRPRRFGGLSVSGAFLSGAEQKPPYRPYQRPWMSERLITLPDGAGASSPISGRTVCWVCSPAAGSA